MVLVCLGAQHQSTLLCVGAGQWGHELKTSHHASSNASGAQMMQFPLHCLTSDSSGMFWPPEKLLHIVSGQPLESYELVTAQQALSQLPRSPD